MLAVSAAPIDDPLAELARIVGADSGRPAQKPFPYAPAQLAGRIEAAAPRAIALPARLAAAAAGTRAPEIDHVARHDAGVGEAASHHAEPPEAAAGPNVDDWSLRGPRSEDASFEAHLARVTPEAAYAAGAPYAAAPVEAHLQVWDEQHDTSGYDGADGGMAADVRPPRRRSMRSLLMVGSILGVAVAGIGGAMLYKGSGNRVTGEAPVILAAKGPMKVQPENPGGVEIPNQNKSILERTAAAPGPSRMVAREEQPIDIAQAARPGARAGSVLPASSTSASPEAALGEPKRVKTVTIRPPEPVQPVPALTVQQAAVLPPTPPARPPVATGTAPRPQVAAATPPAPAASPAQAAPRPQTASATPATPASTTPRVRPAARDESATPTTTASLTASPAPLSISPAEPARPRGPRVASLAPDAGTFATPATVAAPSPAAASGGAWIVQLSSGTTEGAVRETFGRLKAKHGELAAYTPNVRQAEVNGTTRYRLRVGPLTREDAAKLCVSLKSKGTDCVAAHD